MSKVTQENQKSESSVDLDLKIQSKQKSEQPKHRITGNSKILQSRNQAMIISQSQLVLDAADNKDSLIPTIKILEATLDKNHNKNTNNIDSIIIAFEEQSDCTPNSAKKSVKFE